MRNNKFVIDIKNATISIDNRKLFENFNFQLKEGTRTGITGPSGCGKTTLLRSIVKRGLNVELSADYFKITDAPIAYIPQEGGLLPWYTISKNLQIYKGDGELSLNKIEEISEITHLLDKFPEEMSGGEIQRAKLASALASTPKLICADEPFTEMGLKQKWRIIDKWSKIMHETSSSLLLVSHDIDLLMFLCDNIYILGGDLNSPIQILKRININTLNPKNLSWLHEKNFQTLRKEVVDSVYFDKFIE